MVWVPDKQTLVGFHGAARRPFLQVYVAAQPMVSTAKGVLERGLSFGGGASRESPPPHLPSSPALRFGRAAGLQEG